jgi:two-component system chemotaxis response regulator CheY
VQDSILQGGRKRTAGCGKYRTLKPDVFTMDVVMPEMTGIDALKQIKTTIDKDAKIVMCTAIGQKTL